MLYLKAIAVGIVTGMAVLVSVALPFVLRGFYYAASHGGGSYSIMVDEGALGLFSVGFAIGFGGTLWRARAKRRKAI